MITRGSGGSTVFNKLFKRELKIIKQENGAVVFDKKQGIYFQTNDVGVKILELLAKNKTESEIIEHIVNEYSIEYSLAEQDVKEFMLNLKRGWG